MTTTITRSFAARVQLVAELLDDMAELGELHNVYVSHDQVSVQPDAPNALARVAVVGKWAQRFGLAVRILAGPSSTIIKTELTYRSQPVTVLVSLRMRDAWELAGRLQITLNCDAATVEPDQLLTAIVDEGGEQQ